jgi:hypothetical protein
MPKLGFFDTYNLLGKAQPRWRYALLGFKGYRGKALLPPDPFLVVLSLVATRLLHNFEECHCEQSEAISP